MYMSLDSLQLFGLYNVHGIVMVMDLRKNVSKWRWAKTAKLCKSISDSSGRVWAKNCTVVVPIAVVFVVADLADQLALLIFNKTTRDRLLYRSRYQEKSALDDIFAGSHYKSMASQLFPNELDIAFSLYTDGFNSSSSKAGKMAMVHIVINNYHPSIRFKNENMIQMLVMPGPNSAKGDGFWSFLQPLLDEFQTLATSGISVVCDNGNLVTVKAHMLTAIGDLPAVSTMAGHSGHNSYFGCHICPIRGQVGPTRHGMYFPPSNYDAALPWRSSDEFNRNAQDLLWNAPFKGTPLASLKSFNGPVTFGLDELHLLGHGLCKQVLDLITGITTKKGDLFLTNVKVQGLFADMENSRCGIPASFDGSFRTPHSKYTTRSVDYLALISYVVPALFVAELRTAEAKHALLSVVKFLQLAQLRSITEQQLNIMDEHLQVWNDYLQAQVNDQKLTITVYKPNYHYLQHVTAMIRQLGPLYSVSTRCLERTIGRYKKMLKSTKDSGVEAGNVLLTSAATNYVSVVMDGENDGDFDSSAVGTYLDRKTSTIRLRNASVDQLGISHHELNRKLGTTTSSIIITATRISKNGIVYGSRSNATKTTRKDYLMVFKVEVNGNALQPSRPSSNALMFFFGDVLHYIKHGNRYFALVELFQPFFDDTNHMYSFQHPTTNNKTTILDVDDLVTCAGTIASSKSQRSAIIWDQMVLGQDTSAAKCVATFNCITSIKLPIVDMPELVLSL
ncbi:hypothetical protein [Absidia glauca]|uniref:Uncharacterized protein n=1 Tax=Absidia glauca TaxID=4829 RepID=A0A163K5H7_ABSGL|nr:hypothetical protein [Absidia glauca]